MLLLPLIKNEISELVSLNGQISTLTKNVMNLLRTTRIKIFSHNPKILIWLFDAYKKQPLKSDDILNTSKKKKKEENNQN